MGSEMCIRDRHRDLRLAHFESLAADARDKRDDDAAALAASGRGSPTETAGGDRLDELLAKFASGVEDTEPKLMQNPPV